MALIHITELGRVNPSGTLLFEKNHGTIYDLKTMGQAAASSNSKKLYKGLLLSILLALIINLGIFSQAMAQDTVTLTVSGVWTSITGGSSDYYEGVNTQEIKWGNPTYTYKTGMRFDPTAGTLTITTGQEFCLGKITHKNYPISSGTGATGANLKVTTTITNPVIGAKNFDFGMGIDETPNPYYGQRRQTCAESYSPNCGRTLVCCEYGTADTCQNYPCPDQVTFPTNVGSQTFTVGQNTYTLMIVGFTKTCPGGNPTREFITQENMANEAYIVAKIILTSAAIHIEKSTNGVDADTGTGPTILAGCPVTWKYNVTNVGYYALSSVSVIDSPAQTPTRISGDTDNDNVLDLTETWIYTATGTATAGQYSNTATVQGRRGSGYDYVSDTDPSHYLGQTLTFSGPSSLTVCNKGSAAFSVTLTPVDTTPSIYNYQWQSSSNSGATWTDISGAISSTYSLASATHPADNGKQYRVQVALKTQPDCKKTSGTATLTVRPTITLSGPTDLTICNGGTAVFSVTPADTGTYNYKWQQLIGSTWTDIVGATNSPSYSFTPAALSDSGKKYRVLVSYKTGPACEVTSGTATLTVHGGPTVIAPGPQRICSIVPSLVLTGTAENFASLSWTIFSGPGTVTQSDTNPKEATYYTAPDTSAIYTETVVKFTATGIWPCTGSVDSFVTIRVDQKPSAYIEVIAP